MKRFPKAGGNNCQLRSGRLAVLASPRDENPYQELLYGELRRRGVRVTYDDGPTRSRTLNVALMPFMLAWHRALGCQILHLHWVFQFNLPWAKQAPWARWLLEKWFYLYLRTAHLLGYAIVWTAHDITPHAPVFYKDARAHVQLARESDVVIALSQATAAEVASWRARAVRVVPFGAYALPELSEAARQEARRTLGWRHDETVVVHLGKLLPYKGADLLLQVAAGLPGHIRVVVAGACPDEAYAGLLARLARSGASRAELRLGRLNDEEMGLLLLGADVAAFPFREVTNSSSLLLASCYGLPVVAPGLPQLDDLPAGHVLRYDGSVAGLREALVGFSQLSEHQRQQMSSDARSWARSMDWGTVASLTLEAYGEAVRQRCSTSWRANRAQPPERPLRRSN